MKKKALIKSFLDDLRELCRKHNADIEGNEVVIARFTQDPVEFRLELADEIGACGVTNDGRKVGSLETPEKYPHTAQLFGV